MKKILYTLITLSVILTSCKDYLDLVPEDDVVNIEAVFERKVSAIQFLDAAYTGMNYIGSVSFDPAMTGSDEYMTSQNVRNSVPSASGGLFVGGFKIAQGLQNVVFPILQNWGESIESQATYSDAYAGIRVCNIFIANIDAVYDMTDEEKLEYKGEAQALKAFYMFELIRRYGAINIIDGNFDVNVDVAKLKLPRAHLDTCVNYAVDLLDKAIPNLYSKSNISASRYGVMVREAAYMTKVKLLQLAASPLFNGNEFYANLRNKDGELMYSQAYDETKWQRVAVAADEAVEYCHSIGKVLFDETSTEGTELLNKVINYRKMPTTDRFDNSETIWGAWTMGGLDGQLKMFNYLDPNQRDPNVASCLNPTMRMVELFYTENGLPIAEDRNWAYGDRYKMGVELDAGYTNIVALNQDVLNLHLKREPRFYSNIGFDKGYWKTKDDFVLLDPKKDGSNGTDADREDPNEYQNLSGYWTKKMISVNTSLEYGQMSSGTSSPFPVFRLAELYLIQAEAWNEVEGPTSRVYDAIDKVRVRAGIPKVVEAWTSYAKNSGSVSTKVGMRGIIRQEILIEFAFEAHRFWDLRRWKVAEDYMSQPLKGWNVFGSTSEVFYNGFEGPIVIYRENKFQTPRDYLWPIRDEEILISNVKQNLNW